ncbi:MAG: 2-phosphosulfolactate phosphatase [Solobacterium sp.]|nr:2-phosphosulfolactate phosphatase [Solobacterium sp.]
MEIRILRQLKGAEEARGTAVIIDVFRAFSVECYMYAFGAAEVIPVKTVEEAFAFREKDPSVLLAGERNGFKVEGFDLGNSPAELKTVSLKGKRIIHTTSAGVQGIAAAANCSEILTGSLVNAKAIAGYLKKKDPEVVSLVAMGWNAVKDTEEDLLCAEYIRSLLEDRPLPDIKEQALDLRNTEGAKFFDPARVEFVEEDFWMCIETDIYDRVIRVKRTPDGFREELA